MYLIPKGKDPVYIAITQRDFSPGIKPGTLTLNNDDVMITLCEMGFIPHWDAWQFVAWPPEEAGLCPCFLYAQENEEKFLDRLLHRENTFYGVPVRLSERELEFIYPVQFPENRAGMAEAVAEAMERQAEYWDKPCAENATTVGSQGNRTHGAL